MNNGDMPSNVVTEDQWDRSSTVAPVIGLTKREQFAAMAMQGGVAGDCMNNFTPEQHAEFAIKCAGALLQELAK